MNSKDIKHLAHLSRLHITDEEVEEYTKQFDEIVGYVDKIKEFSVDSIPQQVRDDDTASRDKNTPTNIFREDEPKLYTNPETIINESPRHHDNFVQVKKILNQ